MELIKFWSFLLIFAYFQQANSYKILVVNPAAAKSHYTIGKAAADILHEKGHEVTILAAFNSPQIKYNQIVVNELETRAKEFIPVGFQMSNFTISETINNLLNSFPVMFKTFFNDPQIKDLMQGKEKFDAVVIEYFLNEALMGFGIKFDCPIILVSPVGMMTWTAMLTENPLSVSTVPDVLTPNSSPMSFTERIINAVFSVIAQVSSRTLFLPIQEKLYNEFFPEQAKKVPFSEVINKISLIFVNSHPSLTAPRPHLPNAIEVGGYHIGKLQPLPNDLEEILNNAKHGVIFFSMGSNLKSADMQPDIKNAILKTFKSLKETVIWKFEEDLKGKPKNVIIRNWLPQTAILAHPNVKLFITHGGYLSLVEAVNFGKPLLAIPIFGDQYHNTNNIQKKGIGLMLEYKNITKESLKWTIDELLNNPKYTVAATAIQKLFIDRPISPKDLIAYHIEHVIRTNGASYLTPPRLHMYQHLFLDVLGVLVFLPSLLMIIIMTICWKTACFTCCCRRKQNTIKEKKIKKN